MQQAVQQLQQQQPRFIVRAASDTTSSGSSGAPEGQMSSVLMESMQVGEVPHSVRYAPAVRSWDLQLKDITRPV